MPTIGQDAWSNQKKGERVSKMEASRGQDNRKSLAMGTILSMAQNVLRNYLMPILREPYPGVAGCALWPLNYFF